MSLISEFKQFALKGNVMDLAVGVVIGAAFGKIISSIVDDIITPAILTPALTAAKLADLGQLVIPGTAIKYGNFISQMISFVIVAFSLFMVIKAINIAKRKEKAHPTLPPALSQTDTLLTEIRDTLQGKK
jgi:large conductance mechanosensitive channel